MSTSTSESNAAVTNSLAERLEQLNEHYQPTDIIFPSREICGVKRRFSKTWFKNYPWLHYDRASDSAFCFTCIKATRLNAISSTKQEYAFTKKGFSNWKKATSKDGFSAHADSQSHKEAVVRTLKAPLECRNVADSLSDTFRLEQLNNRRMLLKVLSNVRFLARQAIPLRGGWKNESSSEINSNFTQLLMLRTEEDENFVQWLERKQMKYTSPKIQNEMIEIMALGLLRDIAKSIQLAEFYTIMVDETGDASNLEQLVLCLRWVDEELNIHETSLVSMEWK